MPVRHPTRTLPALQPRYVSRFSCLGPSCEDSCCSDWHIGLDKKTFEGYGGSGSERLARVVRINPEPRTEMDFGQIVLTGENKQCPLLEESLCSMHRDAGADSLPHTCFSYPRVWTEVAGQGEQSLHLSCPEAARLALLAPDAFEFEEGSMTVRPDAVRTAQANAGFTAEAINEARYFCIQLMRVRELALWQRLAVLGLFCESLDEPVARQDGQAIFELVEKFTALLQEGALLDSLAQLQPDHAAQAMVFSLLWQGMPLDTPSTVRRHVIREVAAGLGADPLTGQVDAERLVERYREGLARLPDALRAAPHLLEHYLLNEMFLQLFPFDTAKPYNSYLRLVTRFGLLRLMLAARCHPSASLPDAQALVQTVQVHSRRFHHNAGLIRIVDEALSAGGWARLEKLFTLLRT